jgi:hypothetical protein
MWLLTSEHRSPYVFREEMSLQDILNLSDANPDVAHRYGVLIQILPREAIEIIGGWDERFRGWGGEDHATVRATDTLYGPTRPAWPCTPSVAPDAWKTAVNRIL